MRWVMPVGVVALCLLAVGAWSQPYVFVTSAAGNSVAVVDLDGDVLLGSFPLDGVPTGSVLSPDGSHLFVALTEANSLARVDLLNGAVTLIPVGTSPVGLSVDALHVYVANASGDTVSVVDPWSGNPGVVLTIPVGDSPLALAGGAPRLYVANWGDSTVSVVDTSLPGMPVIATLPVGTFPAGLALDLGANRLYVANFLDDTVSVVDTATLSVSATIPVVARPRGLAVDPATGRLYVSGFENADVQVIDMATNQVILEGPSGGANPLDVGLGPGADRLYVVHLQAGKSITVLDAATLAPLTAIDAPPGAITFAGFGTQAPPPGTGRRRLIPDASRAVREWWSRLSAPSPPARRRHARAPSDVVIQDTEFATTNWVYSPHGDFNVQQMTSGGAGGDNGAWRRTQYFESGQVNHEYIAAQYDPSVQGGFGFMAIAFDHESQGFVLDSPVVYQDGVRYLCDAPACMKVSPPGANWTSLSTGALSALHWHDSQGQNPNFGPTGTALTFGYSGVASNQGAEHGIDNFTVTLSSVFGPGILSFQDSVTLADGHPAHFTVPVLREGGTDGLVSVTLQIDNPPDCLFAAMAPTATWNDGDDDPKSIGVSGDCALPHLQATIPLHLVNPTGGATVDADPAAIVWFRSVPTGLTTLFGVLVALFSSVSPSWVLAFGPAALLAWRRRRGRQAGRRDR